MANKQGTLDITDSYINGQPIEARYIGSVKYHDPYSEVSGSLPLVYESRVEHILKNYRIYGTENGAGEETENLFDYTAKNNANGYIGGSYLLDDGTTAGSSISEISEYIPVKPNTKYTFSYNASSLSNPSIGFYNETKEFIEGRSYSGVLPKTVTTTSETKYIRFSLRRNYENEAMFVEGTDLPKSYIPYGYKIPLTDATKNLFNKNDVVTGYEITADGKVAERNTSEYTNPIGVSEGDYTLCYVNVPDIQYRSNIRVNGYDAQDNWVSMLYEYYVINVTPLNKTFQVPQGVTKIRISFRYNNGIDTAKFMVYPGSTAPDSYTPYGSSAYSLYIGSTKLGAEEYVDYAEQKVWKFGANVYDKDDSSMHYGPGYALNTDTYRWVAYTGTGHSWRVPCMPNTKYRIRVPNAVPIFKVATVRTASITTSSNPVNTYGLFVASVETSEYVYTTDSSALYIVMQFSASEASTITESLVVQALQPTDPPVPLPAIIAYKGENVLSSTETLGPVTVKGRISTPST